MSGEHSKPKRKQQSSASRQSVQLPTAAPPSPGVVDHIVVGSFYVIDHSSLSPKSPQQLKSIRVIMVSGKSSSEVSVRFPSICSLRRYFGSEKKSKLPALDEKYIMESEVAAEALFARIKSEELAEKRCSLDFWVADSSLFVEPSSANISCGSELKNSGTIQWGKRKANCFRPHVENRDQVVSDEESDDSSGDEKANEDSEEEEESKVEPKLTMKLRKRKSDSEETSRARRVRVLTREACIRARREKKVTKSTRRWSTTRYNSAEKNILKVLKEQNAVFGNPILRPALRSEARKLIGDTGLLDHLLKHMAGKVAPGGSERFCRRHNADGAMEYWLESADLMNIRKEAGVQDPYWTPPIGWKLGDNPNQDPVCAREIRSLKKKIATLEEHRANDKLGTEEIKHLKEEVKEIRYLKEEMTKIKEALDKLVAEKQGKDLTVVTTQSYSMTNETLDNDSPLAALKQMYLDLVNKKSKFEEQLRQVSESFNQLEGGQMAQLKPSVLNRAVSAPILPKLQLPMEQKKGSEKMVQQATETAANESKAAKTEKLKSGFRLCKPQGTFLWPNMAISPNSHSSLLEELIGIPTPSSASSSTSLPQLLQDAQSPHSPVRPIAEIRPVDITVLSRATTAQSENSFLNSGAPSVSSLILNEVPASSLNSDVKSSK